MVNERSMVFSDKMLRGRPKDVWQEAVTVGHPLRRDFLAQLGSKKEAPTPPPETV